MRRDWINLISSGGILLVVQCLTYHYKFINGTQECFTYIQISYKKPLLHRHSFSPSAVSSSLWIFQQFNHSTNQRINNSTIQQFHKSTIQQINNSTIQTFNNSTFQQFNNSTFQQFNNSTIQQFNNSIFQQFNNSTIQHFNTSTIEQLNKSTTQHFNI